MRDELVKAGNQKSLLGRVMGIFNFVNILWAVSVMGILTTTLPFLLLVWKNVIAPPLKLVAKILEKSALMIYDGIVWTAENLLLPLVLRCHRFGGICYCSPPPLAKTYFATSRFLFLASGRPVRSSCPHSGPVHPGLRVGGRGHPWHLRCGHRCHTIPRGLRVRFHGE